MYSRLKKWGNLYCGQFKLVHLDDDYLISLQFTLYHTAAVAQLVRAFAPKAEGWVVESQPRQILVIKTGSDKFTAKCSALGVSVMGPRRWPLSTDASCRSRCGTLKNPHWLMAMVKICSLSHQWRRLQMSEKFLIGTQNSKQTNKTIKIGISLDVKLDFAETHLLFQ